jgi:hypothetical protein
LIYKTLVIQKKKKSIGVCIEKVVGKIDNYASRLAKMDKVAYTFAPFTSYVRSTTSCSFCPINSKTHTHTPSTHLKSMPKKAKSSLQCFTYIFKINALFPNLQGKRKKKNKNSPNVTKTDNKRALLSTHSYET